MSKNRDDVRQLATQLILNKSNPIKRDEIILWLVSTSFLGIVVFGCAMLGMIFYKMGMPADVAQQTFCASPPGLYDRYTEAEITAEEYLWRFAN